MDTTFKFTYVIVITTLSYLNIIFCFLFFSLKNYFHIKCIACTPRQHLSSMEPESDWWGKKQKKNLVSAKNKKINYKCK